MAGFMKPEWIDIWTVPGTAMKLLLGCAAFTKMTGLV